MKIIVENSNRIVAEVGVAAMPTYAEITAIAVDFRRLTALISHEECDKALRLACSKHIKIAPQPTGAIVGRLAL